MASWSELKAQGYEIETFQEYRDEVRGFHDNEPYEPDEYDLYEDEMRAAHAEDYEPYDDEAADDYDYEGDDDYGY